MQPAPTCIWPIEKLSTGLYIAGHREAQCFATDEAGGEQVCKEAESLMTAKSFQALDPQFFDKPLALVLHPLFFDGAQFLAIEALQLLARTHILLAPDMIGQGSQLTSEFQGVSTELERLVQLCCEGVQKLGRAASDKDGHPQLTIDLLLGCSLGSRLGLEALATYGAGEETGVRVGLDVRRAFFDGLLLARDPQREARAYERKVRKMKGTVKRMPRIAQGTLSKLYNKEIAQIIVQGVLEMPLETAEQLALVGAAALPKLPVVLQEACVFHYGSKEDDAKNIDILKQAYSQAEIHLSSGEQHMTYALTQPQAFCSLVLGSAS